MYVDFSDLTNGCGSDDFNFDGPYTNSFNSACVKHDHCYSCVSQLWEAWLCYWHAHTCTYIYSYDTPAD